MSTRTTRRDSSLCAFLVVEHNAAFLPIHDDDLGGRRIASYSGFGGGDIYSDSEEAEFDAADLARYHPDSTFQVVEISL